MNQQIPVPADALVAFLMVTVRMIAFFSIAPPFASRAVSPRVRGALAIGLSLAVAPTLMSQVGESSTSALLAGIAYQAAVGAAMGFVVMVLMAAIQAAGELIDVMSMFTMASLFDPTSNTQSSLFGRIQQLLATTLLFTSGGHLLIVRGVVSSFDLMPVQPDLGKVSRLLVSDLSAFMISAIEISGPILVVLFVADLAMGLVSRAVPSMNIFALNFPVKTTLTLSLGTVAVTMIPPAVAIVVERSLEHFQPLAKMLGG